MAAVVLDTYVKLIDRAKHEPGGGTCVREYVMIRTESEYRDVVERIRREKHRITEHHDRLVEQGLEPDQVKRVLDPILSLHEQLVEEVSAYERMRRGDFGEIENLHGIGQMLIGLRIYLGLSQRDLATRLGVHESQVSRDERNGYRGLSIERASAILEALHVQVKSTVTPPSAPELAPV